MGGETAWTLYSTDSNKEYCTTLRLVSKLERLHARINLHVLSRDGGRDSSVGIATRYGLEAAGIESWWGRDFPHLTRQALGLTQPPVQWVPDLSRGKDGRGVTLTTHPPSSAEVMKE
jgi:hypothetical protein